MSKVPGATSETDFVKSTAEEVERRERPNRPIRVRQWEQFDRELFGAYVARVGRWPEWMRRPVRFTEGRLSTAKKRLFDIRLIDGIWVATTDRWMTKDLAREMERAVREKEGR